MAPSPLPEFGTRHVRKAALVVRKTGDGLSEKLAFEPEALWPGDEIYLVVKAVVVDVAHPAENRKKPGQDDLIRVHIADAVEVTMVDESIAEPMLKAADHALAAYRLAASEAEQAARLEQERADGIERLPMTNDDEEEPPE